MIDHGYAIANVCYQDIAADYFDGHMTGLGRFCTRNPYDSWGKLRIWAWCMSRIADVLLDDPGIDQKKTAVMGHSRLGKAALLAGAFDTRFGLTVSCQSGAGGAALLRERPESRLKICMEKAPDYGLRETSFSIGKIWKNFPLIPIFCWQ